MNKFLSFIYTLLFNSNLAEDRKQYEYLKDNIQNFEFSDTHLRVSNPIFGEDSFYDEAVRLQKALKQSA